MESIERKAPEERDLTQSFSNSFTTKSGRITLTKSICKSKK